MPILYCLLFTKDSIDLIDQFISTLQRSIQDFLAEGANPITRSSGVCGNRGLSEEAVSSYVKKLLVRSQKENVSWIKHFYWVTLYGTAIFLYKHQIPPTPSQKLAM